MNFAPIALFVYDRLSHLESTITFLKANEQASESILYIFSDAPRSERNESGVAEVRKFIQNIRGFKEVRIVLRPINFGLANSIICGVTEILEHFDKIVVLEDDILVSPFFLKYMNDALNHYADEDRVISIHGYLPPIEHQITASTFFLRGADCWGWATWSRGWKLFNSNGKDLLQQLQDKQLRRDFNFNNSYDYFGMLHDQVSAKNDSWAIRWNASAFLADKLTLYPSYSLVQNIGNDASGTHCVSSNKMDTTIYNFPIKVGQIEIEHSDEAFNFFEQFFRSTGSSIKRKLRLIFDKSYDSISRVQTIKKFIPKSVISLIRGSILFKGQGIYFKGPFENWESAIEKCTGYDEDKIIRKVFHSALKVKRGEAVFERDSVLFYQNEYNWPLISSVMSSLLDDKLNCEVLDFGGALGSTYFQHKLFFDNLESLRWSIIEQEKFVVLGKEFVENHHLNFYPTIDSYLSEGRSPSAILVSAVLQYLKEPYVILDILCSLNANTIILDRLITSLNDKESIYIQYVPESIYKASYPVTSLSLSRITQILSKHGYSKFSTFDTLPFNAVNNIKSEFKGYIFTKKR